MSIQMRASQILIKMNLKGAVEMRAPIDEPIWYAYPGMVAVVTAQYEGEKRHGLRVAYVYRIFSRNVWDIVK